MREELINDKVSFGLFIVFILWVGILLGGLIDRNESDIPKGCEIIETKPLVVEYLDGLAVYPTYELKCDEFANPAYEWSK